MHSGDIVPKPIDPLITSPLLHAAELSTIENCLPAQSRCQITGFLLFDIPEGSNLQTDELVRMRSSVPISTNSTVFAEVLSQITHIFYLWLRYANSYTVLPCVCLPDVVLPQHLGLSGSYLSVTIDPQTTLASPPLGSLFRLDHVLVGHDFVIMDWLSTVQTELRHNVCTGIKIPKFMSMLLENSVLLNSANSLENLKAGNLVHFSGIVAQVNTRRSHTWPVCAYCHCARICARTLVIRADQVCFVASSVAGV
ncbi:hypothetical protein FGIG_09288 [Fasciola gigantica]|uniref:Uncharacterized protein n=1 Tax=Fasciola gigantica TaxID=46835 RepID=A0A504Z366_FASGI|nr:hypothetical protein FGIG_09288 [Fasciola gigantica]